MTLEQIAQYVAELKGVPESMRTQQEEMLLVLAEENAAVRAWYARTNTSDQDELCDAMDELGNSILRRNP